MKASGPLHPEPDDGRRLDATFELIESPAFEIAFHHKARGRDDPRSVNADYHEGLELLLVRLAERGAWVLDISVDSSVARELSPSARRLALDFPIVLSSTSDLAGLRLAITRAQKPVARRSSAKPGGGNDQKRILIRVAFPARPINFDELRDLLVFGTGSSRN